MKLVRAPLVIDYTFYPQKILDIKYVEYKELATVHKDTLTVNRSPKMRGSGSLSGIRTPGRSLKRMGLEDLIPRISGSR